MDTVQNNISSSTTQTIVAPRKTQRHFKALTDRQVEWFGGVTYENLHSSLESIRTHMASDPHGEIQMFVNSYGGATAIGMSFFDLVTSIMKPRLTTIGTGEVDSSGIIIFLSGTKRFLTTNTTLLFHLAGRTFEANKRFSTADMEAALKENKLRDYQYACVVSDATDGRYAPEDILEMMRRETIITADEAVQMGLAHRVLAE